MLSLQHVSQQDVDRMTPESVAELARRLEADAYDNAFEGLQDWHLLRAIAFQRPRTGRVLSLPVRYGSL
jgi:hypothetical protein